MSHETITECDNCETDVVPSENALIGLVCPNCDATIESTLFPGPGKPHGGEANL